MRLALIALSLGALPAQAAVSVDSAVFLAFRHADPGPDHFSIVQRTAVSEQFDLVVAMGSPKPLPFDRFPWTMWGEQRRIGLFLQEKSNPDRVYLIGIKSGFQDCAARLERVTATDTVISCQGEKSERLPNQKWVYDLRSKGVVKQFEYQPVPMVRGFPDPAGPVFIGSDRLKLVAMQYAPDRDPPFRVLTDAEAKPWIALVPANMGWEGMDRHPVLYIENEKTPVPPAQLTLHRTSYEHFAAARPQRVKDGYKKEGITLEDKLGPWQRDGDHIWFAKNFYDGEGTTGVGGFGYFDTGEGKLHLFEPPDIVNWSVSAMSVGPEAVWLALVDNGEYGGMPGGLLRYDRQTEVVRKIALPDIAGTLIPAGDKILAATDFGMAVISGDHVNRYFVDVTTDGRLRIAHATVASVIEKP